MLQNDGHLRRRKSDGDLSLEIMDEEEKKPLLSSRVELPQYQSTDRLAEEEKAEYKSLYTISDEKITIIPLSQLKQLNTLLEALIQDQSHCLIRLGDYCKNKLEKFRRDPRVLMLSCFFLLPVPLGAGACWFFRTLNQAAKISLKNWHAILSGHSNVTCAVAYNAIAKCIRQFTNGSWIANLTLTGVLESDDPSCYKALYDLCSNSCEWGVDSIAKDCTGEAFKLPTMAVVILLLSPLALAGCKKLGICGYAPSFYVTRQARRLFHFFTSNRELFEEIGLNYNVNQSAENLLQQTENEIKHVYFFKNRRQLVAEKLPVYEKHKANLAEIVDEYLGISIR